MPNSNEDEIEAMIERDHVTDGLWAFQKPLTERAAIVSAGDEDDIAGLAEDIVASVADGFSDDEIQLTFFAMMVSAECNQRLINVRRAKSKHDDEIRAWCNENGHMIHGGDVGRFGCECGWKAPMEHKYTEDDNGASYIEACRFVEAHRNQAWFVK